MLCSENEQERRGKGQKRALVWAFISLSVNEEAGPYDLKGPTVSDCSFVAYMCPTVSKHHLGSLICAIPCPSWWRLMGSK